ncbi:type II toxin-antitoxin system VapC family toxin [Georgenia subflava]|uniref:Ribonuclease VapC n=1 Tax=Georgenia subflava TaxID=1622177 RepID=A0A6N7EI14_9MICO|nr:type II toxin-antitoxin system VapC family toxin [Georgenia subflava]MPV36367.1 PIN domain-containing protein [Georgenia subflava]
MIVLDSSAAIKALAGDDDARHAIRSAPVFAPHLIDTEVTSALRGLVLGRKISATEAEAMMDTWPRLGVVRFAAHPLMRRIWELRDNLTAYDATYVALAEELGCLLLTADARIPAAPGVRCAVTVLRA